MRDAIQSYYKNIRSTTSKPKPSPIHSAEMSEVERLNLTIGSYERQLEEASETITDPRTKSWQNGKNWVSDSSTKREELDESKAKAADLHRNRVADLDGGSWRRRKRASEMQIS